MGAIVLRQRLPAAERTVAAECCPADVAVRVQRSFLSALHTLSLGLG